MMSKTPHNKPMLFADPYLMDQLLAFLMADKHDEFFELVYKTIDNNTDYLFQDDGVDLDFKEMQLNTMLEYYIELEAYEKCSSIKKWIDSIHEYKTSSVYISDAKIID